MSIDELIAWMDRHLTRSAFRLETLQRYEVGTDGSDYRRWLDGESTWTADRKLPWLDYLAAEKRRGIYRHRVRLVTRPVSDYTRYACEWGYAPNVEAGEDVRVLDLGERELPDVDLPFYDWWLITDSTGSVHVARMLYADDGSFLGASEDEALAFDVYTSARDALWAAAEPFTSWWPRHPELRRDGAPLTEVTATG